MKLVSKSNNERRSNEVQRSTTVSRNGDLNQIKPVSRANDANRSNAVYRSNGASRADIASRENGVSRGSEANRGNAVNRSNGAYRSNSANQPVTAKGPVHKKKSPAKAATIIVLVIVIICSALFVALGFYVSSLDTVFPNVWADGINLSGLTLDEATQTLINAGYERNAEGISVTIVFPDDTSFSVSGAEVGLSLNASEAAFAAFSFGRDESFFRNEITYIRSIFNGTELSDLSTPSFDDSIIRERASEYTSQFNKTLLDSNLERTDDSITIVKGTGLHTADESEVFGLAVHTINRAVEENEHLTAHYTPERNLDDTIDLNLLYAEIHVEPVTSRWDVETLSATVSSEGRTFDLEEAEEKLRNAENGSTIVIPILVLMPEFTTQDIEAMIFRDELAATTTRMTNISNRIHNINLTAVAINGTVLNPGEVFSFNEIVGPRTRERGFLEANVIIGGVLQPGIGGGICQMSSTLYSSVIHTHLEVVERRPHGLTVSYLPYGQDATVVFASNTDFRFKNNTDFPLRIESKVDGRDLSVRLIGTKLDDTYIEVESVVISRTAIVNERRETEEMLIGEEGIMTGSGGQEGVHVEVFQLHYTGDGELISRTSIGISRYSMQPRVTLVGTRIPEPVYHPEPGGEAPAEG